MTPSKSPQAMLWSSTAIARRLSRGSMDGPFGTAQDLNVPATSSRKSKCRLVAWCCWMTKRGTPALVPGAQGLYLERPLVAGLDLEGAVLDAESIADEVGQLAPVGLRVAARAHGDVSRQRRHARGHLPHVQVVDLDHVRL